MPVVMPVNDESVTRAAALLREGKLVAFPTETVYGLGGNALDGHAVAAIYAAKGRPTFNPLIIHVAETQALDSLIEWTPEARALATAFWPGPMTLVLPRKKNTLVSLLASAGLDTMAVRIPSHPAAQRLLREVDLPIAAPSANASGKLSPTTAEHVVESLSDNVDMVLAGGRCQVGVESTVINMASDVISILRPGGITPEQISRVLDRDVTLFHAKPAEGQALPSPGMLSSHYAPRLSVRLNAEQAQPGEAYIAFGPTMGQQGAHQLNLSESGDLNEAAANLFALMRQADQPQFTGIAIAPIPDTGLGLAINDRLRRAAADR